MEFILKIKNELTKVQLLMKEDGDLNKKRMDYIDFAKGLSIILMIVGHVLNLGWKRQIIFSFHMPLFVMCSGFFFKSRNLKEEIIIVLKKFILPYMIILLLGNCIDFFIQGNIKFDILKLYIIKYFKTVLFSYSYKGNLKIYENIPAIGVLWFIPMLAIVRLIFSSIQKVIKNDKIYKVSLTVVLLTFLGYILGSRKIFLPFSSDIALFCLGFYYVGYLIKKYEILEKMDIKTFILILIIWIMGTQYACIELAVRKYPTFSYITTICGSVTIIIISKFICSKWKKYNIINWAGINSLIILGIHHCEFKIFNLFDYQKILSKNISILKLEKSLIWIIFCLLVCYFYTIIIKIIKRILKFHF